MILTRKESLLLLRRTDSGRRKVEIASALADALPTWNGLDRVSPIFEIETSHSKTAFTFKRGSAFLLFLGPVNPALADSSLPFLKGKNGRAWLTFGLFNLVCYTSSPREAKAILAWARKHRVRWEKWELDGSEIGKVTYSQRTDARPDDLLRSLAQFRFKTPIRELRDAAEEYCVLLAAAACRSIEIDPQITSELERANSIITQSAYCLSAPRLNGRVLPAVALLVDANAALSRFTSQTFSGTSPIVETECHFWTHSLLGTGTANLALLKIRRFITQTLGEARIPEQVRLLEQVTDDRLITEVIRDGAIWNGPWLQNLPDLIGRRPLLKDLSPLAPLITYLSGRDGFHTTQTSLSAPLNILTSCSSPRWSLLTITHEMSHRVVNEALSYILPDHSNPAELSAAAALLNEAKRPANLLEALRFKVLYTMAELNDFAPLVDFPDVVTEKPIVDLMGRRGEEVEEVMAHVFDFMYFYGSDPEVYVPAIWRSWDSIPSLHRRLRGYVLRTLCAVMTKFWTSRTPTQDAIAAVKAGMERAAKSDKANVYIKESLDFLNEEEDNLKKQMWLRRTLV